MHKGDKKSISVNLLCQGNKDKQHKHDSDVLKYDGFRGIKFTNLTGNNSCYMNAAVNCLFNCETIMSLIN